MTKLIPAVHQITMELTKKQFIELFATLITINIQNMLGNNDSTAQDIIQHQLYQTTRLIIIKIITSNLTSQPKHTMIVSWINKHRDKQKFSETIVDNQI